MEKKKWKYNKKKIGKRSENIEKKKIIQDLFVMYIHNISILCDMCDLCVCENVPFYVIENTQKQTAYKKNKIQHKTSSRMGFFFCKKWNIHKSMIYLY